MRKNREYKSDVFSMLMESKENALEVYNALNDSEYTNPEDMEIVQLERGVSLSIRNDASFIIDMNINFYEHQSTYNPNMPLRSLIYFVNALEDWLKDNDKDLFSKKQIQIPTPHFIVFYNGKRKMPDRWTNCLSESYENQQGEPNLELKVVTININRDCNRQLMDQCRILGEYAQYVEKVRKNAETMSLDVAVKEAVDECIQKGILANFLRVNRAEVIAMSIFEYDKEEEEKKLQLTYEKQGELKKAKSIAISLAQEGESVERIARILGETEKTIKEWL